MVSGEQIIAKIELIENVYSIKNPAIIVPVGKGELALAPWLPYTTVDQTGVQIHKDRITFVLTPQPELANNYNESFINSNNLQIELIIILIFFIILFVNYLNNIKNWYKKIKNLVLNIFKYKK